MSFDNSRFTFHPWKNYSGVVMEQGRVQLDSDWNEWLAEVSRRIQAGTLDIMGHAAYPATTPYAFQITAYTNPNKITIGRGRMYVDGLLAENHGDPTKAAWDPALAELSGSPQPPSTSSSDTNPIDFTQQPYYPGAEVHAGQGRFLAYLDVWTRPVTWLEDPDLIDKAVGVDTTGRLQTVWQVKLMEISVRSDWTCATPDCEIFPPPSAGRLCTDVITNASAGPCCLTAGTGYTGVENQFYRVEIHQPGPGTDSANGATFKWSRDNASVETGVTAIASANNSLGATSSQLTVLSLGRDQVLGFAPGNWIEILNDSLELNGQPGELCLIDSIDVSGKTITLRSPLTYASFPVGTPDSSSHTRIRRWGQSGTVYKLNGNKQEPWCDLSTNGGAIPVPASDTTLVLESGITVTFSTKPAAGSFNVGDFWTFAARTADGSVEKLVDAPPRGIHHHYTKLSVVTFNPPTNPDCRTKWACTDQGDCGCCTCTVGDGVESFGQFTSINQAIQSLPATGGEVCILPGRYYERVVIENLIDVVIRGCGSQTRLASPSMQPGGTADPAGLNAIISVVGSQHIELRSFAVEAADGEVGILLDQSPEPKDQTLVPKKRDNADITIEGLVITASTLPAVVAVNVALLKITNNRVAMKDVSSLWASVYASGTEIQIDHNWIGLQDASNADKWIPASVVRDVSSGFDPASAPTTPLANGGIQIGGSSQDVFIVENEIEGGWRNGITLGSLVILENEMDSSSPTGLVVAGTNLSSPATLQLPSGQGIGAGGVLQNIRIERNRIRNMGLCGIGPVGFFDLEETLEVISIENLTITANTISGTLQDTIAPYEAPVYLPTFGYGAICIPDVQNLIVRDNTITDFGSTPGAQVCGIFVLSGEQVEISRNQVLETRDWSFVPSAATSSGSAAQAGIMIFLVTPPALDQATGSAWVSPAVTPGSEIPLAPPIYQPGLPALRVENNVVRVPLGLALEALGYGPFSIVANHLSSGGTVTSGDTVTVAAASLRNALTVFIVNLGLAIEFDNQGGRYYDMYEDTLRSETALRVADNALASSSTGAVLFTNNICQLETRVSGVQGNASVEIYSYDHVIFSDNHCWLDGNTSGGMPTTAAMDAFLFAGSLHACGNRFQESACSVCISAYTSASLNITAHNIATYCLFARGRRLIDGRNLVIDSTLCCDPVVT